MCGIAGSFRRGGATRADRVSVARMMHALAHRGPDGEGAWEDAEVVLGHRRLAVIDLNGGQQPLFDESGQIAVVFNGEIYNFADLRSQLVGRGHRFRTATDTEVLVHGYEEWGIDVVTRQRGMFAFALWDAVRHRLVLARDRLGIKPLYVWRDARQHHLRFASEIKAVATDAGVPRRINRDVVAEYLIFRSVAGRSTLFEGIDEVPPGTVMIVDGHGCVERSYWRPSAEVREGGDGHDFVREGRELLRESVRMHLVSDVGLGTITSGGLDSSCITALACETHGAPVTTFCAGFGDASFDERPYAQRVARSLDAPYHECVIDAEDVDADLELLTWAHDEPLTHPNSIAMHRILRVAKERAGVTVVLSGEGADEVFGGYERYRIAAQRARLQRFAFAGTASQYVPGRWGRTLRRVLSPEYLIASGGLTDPAMAAPLFDDAGAWRRSREAHFPNHGDALGQLFVYDQQTYLPPLLQRQDRMSMAAGVEARVPFLDHHLVEWANAIPAREKLTGGVPKGLLRSMAEPWLGRETLTRRKVGFALPISRWLARGGTLAHRVDALRDTSCFVRTLVDGDALDTILRRRMTGEGADTDLLWTLIALEAWASTFLGPDLPVRGLPGAATGRLEAMSLPESA